MSLNQPDKSWIALGSSVTLHHRSRYFQCHFSHFIRSVWPDLAYWIPQRDFINAYFYWFYSNYSNTYSTLYYHVTKLVVKWKNIKIITLISIESLISCNLNIFCSHCITCCKIRQFMNFCLMICFSGDNEEELLNGMLYNKILHIRGINVVEISSMKPFPFSKIILLQQCFPCS